MYTLIVISVSYGIFTSLSGSLSYREELVRQQEFSQIFQYLVINSGPECVALVYSKTETLEKAIPAYTHCDVYNSSYVFAGVPEERVIHNFLLKMRLSGVSVKDSEAYLLLHEDEVRYVSYRDWGELFGRGGDEWYLEQVKFLKEKYIKFEKLNFKEQLLSYRMDYLISDVPLQMSILESLPNLKLGTSTDTYYIYSFSGNGGNMAEY